MAGDPTSTGHKKRHIFGRVKDALKKRAEDRYQVPEGREANTRDEGTARDTNSDRVNSHVYKPNSDEPKADDGNAKDYWQMAYETLTETERNILVKHLPGIPATTEPLENGRARTKQILDQVIEATKSQYKDNQGKDGIREKAQKILNCVLSFQDVVKSALQFDPTGYASSAWGIVSLGLTMAKNHATLRDALVESSEYLADLLSRCAFIEEQFYHNSEPGIRNGEKERSIVRIYGAVFQYTIAIRKSQDFNKGEEIVNSITAGASQQLEQLKTSIKEEESHMHHWLLLDEHLHRKSEADQILADVRQLHHTITLLNLPIADGAFFDSFLDQHEDECLPGTRTELLREVREWGRSSDRCIFWLSGMAGTGKSTIARSVARSFQNDGILGASFFFKRGDGERGSASKLFPTIAKQLASHIPRIIDGIQESLENDPAIAGKSLRLQFDRLIMQPLRAVGQNNVAITAVIVIDALDECNREEDVELILELLPKVEEATNVKIRFFLTSRPESPIRFGFDQIDHRSFQNTILQNLDNDVIEHDITIYLEDEFSKIRKKRHRGLSPDWPGEDRIKALAQMAVPLFILAATVCRFVAEKRFNPEKRLQQFSQDTPGSKMDKTYQPILNQLLVEDEEDMQTLIGEFQKVIGVIICLAAPLSLSSLAELFEMSESDISNQLDLFHSVLSIPTDPAIPIRTLHLSFRDYLVHEHTKSQESTSRFWVDENLKHEFIARQCLAIMDRHLRKNICGLSSYGTLRAEIDQASISRFLPPSLQYACRYWIHHLTHSLSPVNILELAFAFLEKHFLHWLESMSISGVMFEAINGVNTLIELTKVSTTHNPLWKEIYSLCQVQASFNEEHRSLLKDARRFLRNFTSIVDKAPLQLYSCGLIFTPENALIRRTFEDNPPHWLSRVPIVEKDWSPVLQTLEGPRWDPNISICFPLGGRLLASLFSGTNSTIKLWDLTNGELVRTTVARFDDKSETNSAAFSPDGQLIASGALNCSIYLWNSTSGEVVRKLVGHSDTTELIVFSPDGQLVASASGEHTIKLWDVTTGDLKHTLRSHLDIIHALAFSPDSQYPILASASSDCTIKLWDPISGSLKHTLHGHEDLVFSIAFSSDHSDPLLASGSKDLTIRLWNPATGDHKYTLKGHKAPVREIAFSPVSSLLASGSEDRTIKVWNTSNGNLKHTFDAYASLVASLAISPQQDSLLLASGHYDGTIRIWDPDAGDLKRSPEDHLDTVTCMDFSRDGRLLASASIDHSTVKLWDVATGRLKRTLMGHTQNVDSVVFSSDGHLELLASGSRDCTVKLWNPVTGCLWHTLNGHTKSVRSVAFSPDSKNPLLASGSDDCSIRLWNPITGENMHILSGHAFGVRAISFFPDTQRPVLASFSVDGIIKLWNTQTGALRHTLVDWLGAFPDRIWFSTDLKRIVTADMSFNNPEWYQDISDDMTIEQSKLGDFVPGHEKHLHLDRSREWIIIDGKREVWVPPDYEVLDYAVKGSTIAIRCYTGRIFIIQCRISDFVS
ncbi:hypothetical protein N7528_006794 [Penicillium herquei]|nr:hypothetical protein N7528_006794 [Penicillium herquei]